MNPRKKLGGMMSKGDERRRRDRQDEMDNHSIVWRVLLLVPKNLVYLFLIVILGSFAAMSYITYTEQNMTEFLVYNRTRMAIEVDPVFIDLQGKMPLDQEKVETRPKSLSNMDFNKFFMSQNRPVKIEGMASDWKALQTWQDKQYLNSIISTSEIAHLEKKAGKFSEYQKTPKRTLLGMAEATKHILNNPVSSTVSPITKNKGETGKDDDDAESKKHPMVAQGPYISYIEDLILPSSSAIRQGFELLYLQNFLNYQGASLTIWP